MAKQEQKILSFEIGDQGHVTVGPNNFTFYTEEAGQKVLVSFHSIPQKLMLALAEAIPQAIREEKGIAEILGRGEGGKQSQPVETTELLEERLWPLVSEARALMGVLSEDKGSDDQDRLHAISFLEAVKGLRGELSPEVARIDVTHARASSWTPIGKAQAIRDEIRAIVDAFEASGVEDDKFAFYVRQVTGMVDEF